MDQSMLDSIWVLFAAFLVFFMHSGFALVESGFCRKKNAVMVLLKNVGVVALASVVFWVVGYGVMFGADAGGVVGTDTFLPNGSEAMVGTLPVLVFVFFQLVFAATSCTIVSGAVAERAALPAFFVFVVIATALIYPVVGHWVWGGGWLAAQNFHDFAGSTVVHAVGGGMALAGAIVVGPRIGKYDDKGNSRPMPAHNFPLAALGVLVLWLGWFGFNGGSTVSAEDPAAIASIVLVTNLAASTGFLGALAWIRFRTGMLDLSMALNGALAGLVGITAGCDVIGPGWALLVGLIAGIIGVESVFFFDKRKIDDPVGAITVHGVVGMFGTIAVGLFGTDIGLLTGGGASALIVQIYGTLAGFGFAFVSAFIVWTVLKATIGVRVSRDHELEGLDIAECGVEAYGAEPMGLADSGRTHHMSEPEPAE